MTSARSGPACERRTETSVSSGELLRTLTCSKATYARADSSTAAGSYTSWERAMCSQSLSDIIARHLSRPLWPAPCPPGRGSLLPVHRRGLVLRRRPLQRSIHAAAPSRERCLVSLAGRSGHSQILLISYRAQFRPPLHGCE